MPQTSSRRAWGEHSADDAPHQPQGKVKALWGGLNWQKDEYSKNSRAWGRPRAGRRESFRVYREEFFFWQKMDGRDRWPFWSESIQDQKRRPTLTVIRTRCCKLPSRGARTPTANQRSRRDEWPRWKSSLWVWTQPRVSHSGVGGDQVYRGAVNHHKVAHEVSSDGEQILNHSQRASGEKTTRKQQGHEGREQGDHRRSGEWWKEPKEHNQ